MIPLVAALSTLRPLLLKHAVDVEIPDRDGIGLRVLAHRSSSCAVVAEFLCRPCRSTRCNAAATPTINDLRRNVFSHVLRLPARFYDNNAIGSLLSRTTTDVEALSETLRSACSRS